MHLPRFGSMVLLISLSMIRTAMGQSDSLQSVEKQFVSPPDSARPWVYWYFMDGNMTREGMSADLRAMKKAGIGGGIILEVNQGIRRGPVPFMSDTWQHLIADAVHEADDLGLELAIGTGPGWCGTGGPWVPADQSMQHLVSSLTSTKGPAHFHKVLAQPQPRTPYFGMGSLPPGLKKEWQSFYKDVAVVAYPTPPTKSRITDLDRLSLVYRDPFSSGTVKPLYPMPMEFNADPQQAVPKEKLIDLTGKLQPDGTLDWDAPPGDWTILRMGRTLTGQTTRPAPTPGLGFETDKFDPNAIDAHLQNYVGKLLSVIGTPNHNGHGLTTLHFDSWEMGAQNWSPHFREQFIKLRGYDPLPYLPIMFGQRIDSDELSQRFLWDLRQTSNQLIVANHASRIRDFAHNQHLLFSIEPYDLNPSADLNLGSTGDVPMGEFWSRGFGFNAEYSVIEAVSVAHTNGKNIIGAEAFTANPREAWQQYPGSMKQQTDWAFCSGLNRLDFHRYQHQPNLTDFPGMTMAGYGVHWERTQTFWDMVPAYHTYIARCSAMLRRGLPVVDILYLASEGAPHVFRPPPSATKGPLQDHRGYAFDGCDPINLIANAAVKDGRIVFPGGMSYRLLVLPRTPAMTPELLQKIKALADAGATIVGQPPTYSPSLSGYPHADAQVQELSNELWSQGEKKIIFDDGKDAGGQEDPLATARWIWFNEGNPAAAAPIGERLFKRALVLPTQKHIASAKATITADNTFVLTINGSDVGSGDNFHTRYSFDVTPMLKLGDNLISVTAQNTGDSPNPAGLIANIIIQFTDGTSTSIATDDQWSASIAGNGEAQPSKELGDVAMGPWNIGLMNPAAYNEFPDYQTTAALLQKLGIVPDLQAPDEVRFAHRRDATGDYYFVSNSGDHEIAETFKFRVAGAVPLWWDPITGQERSFHEFKSKDVTTEIPMRLGSGESGFVVFPSLAKDWPASTTNFPVYESALKIAGPWKVSFDTARGGPESVMFQNLDDWSTRVEPGIRYYSGKAVYQTNFDAPQSLQQKDSKLSLGDVKNIASVKLNGQDLGVVWCLPWQVRIPKGCLKEKENQLEITVANLWINRLIGDSGLKQNERITKTTWNPFKKDSRLQPSGVLGPVEIMTSK